MKKLIIFNIHVLFVSISILLTTVIPPPLDESMKEGFSEKQIEILKKAKSNGFIEAQNQDIKFALFLIGVIVVNTVAILYFVSKKKP